jgi:hypothetical protein
MKHRARTIGEQGMHQCVSDLQRTSNTQVHLMGHSFGCVVVSSILGGPGGSTRLPRAVSSAVLVQGAMSLWAYAEKIPGADKPGYFRRVLNGAVSGPIVTTQSSHDTAVGAAYPAAVGLVNEFDFGTALPRFGGLGTWGIQGTALAEKQAMLDEKGVYTFKPGRIYNLAIVRGEGGRPAILFTGSHGAEWSLKTPDIQKARQGALVSQEWTRGEPLETGHYFAGEDVPADASVHGLVMFLFACFGGGSPDTDSYYYARDGSPLPLAPQPLIARLPQTLLSRGALAVIAHVDRAFSYAFEDVMGTPQAQLLRTPLELLMKGRRIGLATDPLNLQWSSLAAQLGMALGGNAPGAPPPRSPLLANLYIGRDDARNYVVLGDPAARVRTEGLA